MQDELSSGGFLFKCKREEQTKILKSDATGSRGRAENKILPGGIKVLQNPLH